MKGLVFRADCSEGITANLMPGQGKVQLKNPIAETPIVASNQQGSPWLTATEAARYVQASPKTLYREARGGRLRHARIGGRRELRFRREWLDEWLEATTTPVEIRR